MDQKSKRDLQKINELIIHCIQSENGAYDMNDTIHQLKK